MFFDKETTLSNKQSIAGTGTIVSTNTIDLFNGRSSQQVGPYGVASLYDPGRSNSPEFIGQITKTVVGGTSVTLQIVESDNANLSSPVVVTQSAAVPIASLKAGYQFKVALVPGITKRYLGANYVIVGTTTDGEITTGFVVDKQLDYVF